MPEILYVYVNSESSYLSFDKHSKIACLEEFLAIQIDEDFIISLYARKE